MGDDCSLEYSRGVLSQMVSCRLQPGLSVGQPPLRSFVLPQDRMPSGPGVVHNARANRGDGGVPTSNSLKASNVVPMTVSLNPDLAKRPSHYCEVSQRNVPITLQLQQWARAEKTRSGVRAKGADQGRERARCGGRLGFHGNGPRVAVDKPDRLRPIRIDRSLGKTPPAISMARKARCVTSRFQRTALRST
jgi:hypothetical protein